MKKCFFVMLSLLLASGVSAPLSAVAETGSPTIMTTDITVAPDTSIMVGIEGEFMEGQAEALALINKIRKEACDTGVKNPVTGVKLTSADYVPLKWSEDLEYIARIRAAEAAITIDHWRTNGKYCGDIKSPNGVTSSAENLAWTYSDDMVDAIDTWYKEKADWTKGITKDTGHYTTMIDPRNTYVGIGTFLDEYSYMDTTAAEFGRNLTDVSNTMKPGAYGIQALELSKGYCDSVKLSSSDDVNFSLIVTTTPFEFGAVEVVALDGVEWSVDNTDVATISDDGVLTRKKCGSVTVTGKLNDSKKDSKTLNVDHVFDEGTVITPAKCETAGKKLCKCNGCSETKEVEIPATGHTKPSADKIEVVDATCTLTGSKTYTCPSCNEIITEEIPMIAHNYSSEWTIDLPATCTQDGLKSHHCTECGASSETPVTIPATGHTKPSADKIDVVEPTCTTTGSRTYTCPSCNEPITEEIPMAAHKFSSEWETHYDATCTQDGLMVHTCEECGATSHDIKVIPAKGHTYGAWTIEKNATCKSTGVKSHLCTVCNTKATASIPVTAHTFNIYDKCSKCGTYASYINTSVAKMTVKSISKAKGAFTVKWKKNTKVNGYEIRYSLKPTMASSKKVTISKNKTTSKKIKGAKKTKYYVQIRAFKKIGGTKKYSPWSAIKNVTTK